MPDLLSQLLVFEFGVLVVIPVHDQAFEGVRALCEHDPARQLRQQEPDSILTNAVDAFDIGAVFALVSDENSAAGADDFQFLLSVSMQIPAQLSRDEVHLFHLLGRLGDELIGWELTADEAVVGLDVLNVRV